MTSLAFLHMPQGMELFIILGFALLIFGKNLPQVGRSIGRSVVEFKKGLKGIEDEVEAAEITKQKDPAQLT